MSCGYINILAPWTGATQLPSSPYGAANPKDFAPPRRQPTDEFAAVYIDKVG